MNSKTADSPFPGCSFQRFCSFVAETGTNQIWRRQKFHVVGASTPVGGVGGGGDGGVKQAAV